MKNTKKGILIFLIPLFSLASMWANGEAENQRTETKAPVEISYVSNAGGRIVKEDNPVVAFFNEKFGMKLKMELLDGDTYKQKIPIIIASGDLPDMLRLDGYTHFDFVTQDVFLQLDDRLSGYPNIQKYVDPQAWELTKYKGKIYCIPSANYTGKYVTNMRKDWLDAVGMDVPTNLDEYYAALYAFTFNDPDGDGKDNTYGIGTRSGSRSESFMNIFGAYGGVAGYNIIRDETIVTFDISEEYRNSLRFVKKLYDEGILDPESLIHKQAQGEEKIVRSKVGTFTAWWSIVPQVLNAKYKMNEINPKADWVMVSPLKGPQGHFGMQKRNLVNYSVVLSKKTKQAEKVLEFLDYLISDEGTWTAFLGIQGTHWKMDDGSRIRTEIGQKAFDEKWLDVFSQTVLRPDLVLVWYAENDPSTTDYIFNAQEWGTIPEAFEGIITPEYQQYNGEITKYTDESFVRFIMGDLSLETDWDKYVAGWKSRGGEKMRQSQLAVYNQNRGTNYIFGN